ncbi:FAD-binding oxidoreductase [Luteipulveratus sp. YIM 133132]|uniref:globin domain-containing protein n=1 Tax=Luteipulveratus flavus TaxID=3031728 RepID=UPI0023B07D47|nr:globin domain-containing protein [Luteipulveratus sp. YIM 133132]MDE9364827.1 FAD-binding oxidoreductase [Luteipulveratus sp. YIM 133132]
MDTDALKHTWALAEKAGDEVPLWFYGHLFLEHPELREMFPVSMATQRDRLVSALGRIVSDVDRLDEVTGFIQQLGRDHRRFQVMADHYGAVGASLLATLEHFLGAEWTPQVAADWAAAYGVIATAMVQAAEESEDYQPASWDGEVLSVDRRTLDVAVLQVRPNQRMEYVAGQSVAVEIPQHPRLWRYLSPANAPRRNGTLELHVQRVPGGQVSAALVTSVKPGQTLRLGAPIGETLTLPVDNERPLLMIAGSTGLAPLRAHLERIDHEWQRSGTAPQVHLFHGVRHPWNLYEHELLTQLTARPWFDYTPVVSDDPTFPGSRGLVGEVATDGRDWQGRIALVCGSPEMVDHTVERLEALGLPTADIRYEQFATAKEQRPTFPDINESGDQS